MINLLNENEAIVDFLSNQIDLLKVTTSLRILFQKKINILQTKVKNIKKKMFPGQKSVRNYLKILFEKTGALFDQFARGK